MNKKIYKILRLCIHKYYFQKENRQSVYCNKKRLAVDCRRQTVLQQQNILLLHLRGGPNDPMSISSNSLFLVQPFLSHLQRSLELVFLLTRILSDGFVQELGID